MAGKEWGSEKRRVVLEAFALSGNYAEVSRACGVPPSTVARWCKGSRAEIEEITDRNRLIAERAIQESLEARMEEIAAFGQELRQKALELLPNLRRATPSGVAALGRAAVEIELKGLGKPTDTIELRGKLLDEAIERELAKLAAAAEERVSDATGEGSQGD